MSGEATAKNPDEQPDQETPVVEEAVEVVEKMRSIPMNRMGLEVEHNNTWRVNVPHGTMPEQLFEESVWAHLAIMLKPGDQINVRPDDMAWELILHVQGVGKTYAHVIEKVFYKLAATERGQRLPSIYKIEYAGTTYKWRVIRGDKLIRDGFESEALARRYAANHEAAVDR